MVKVYYDKDANLAVLKNKKVAIIGYGSQGHAHAQNLQDSGVNVIVGLRQDSRHWAEAVEAGLKVMSPKEAANEGDVIMMLVPDQIQAKIYKEAVEPVLKPGKALAFATGSRYIWGR